MSTASTVDRRSGPLDRVRRMTAGILIVEDDRNIGDLVHDSCRQSRSLLS